VWQYSSQAIVLDLKKMATLTDRLKAFAFSKGADLIGMAPVSRFRNAPKDHHPGDILEGAKTVFACAKRFPNSMVLHGPATSHDFYMTLVENLLDQIAYEIALFVEENDGLAIPVSADGPYFDWHEKNKHGRGDLSHKHAAEAAGLGVLGKNSLLITPKFGNRVQLVSIVTDLELEPDPMIKEEVCPPGCRLCIDACPVSAIQEDGSVVQKLCRPTMYYKLTGGTVVTSCRECRKVCPAGI
jgi:epoxyqueuosine reductase QueG